MKMQAKSDAVSSDGSYRAKATGANKLRPGNLAASVAAAKLARAKGLAEAIKVAR